MLPRSFYERDTLTVAQELLGKTLVRKTADGVTSGIIVETEAYLGKIDDAAHSYKKNSKRVTVQYGPAGFSYIYFIYGMHTCMNVTSGPLGSPEAILIRALEPKDGIELMRKRRNTEKIKNLCNGPGKLCQAMNITRELYGVDLCSHDDGLWIESGLENIEISATKRINIDYAVNCRDNLWRFIIKDNCFVSVK